VARGKYEAKRRRRRLNPGFIVFLLLIVVAVCGAVLILLRGCDSHTPHETESTSTAGTKQHFEFPNATTTTTVPISTEPYIAATASIGVTGDIMGHLPVINSCKTADGYDFTSIYTYIKPYYESYDFMVANLEVNLGGPEAGPYKGYPTFNSPDEVAYALKDAGVDMLLTANNHSYDIGHNSFIRTQNVLNELGMKYLGTKLDETTPNYTVQDINGIQVGMVCYTYETGSPSNPRKQLNGIALTEADSALVSSFNYNDLQGFYEEVDQTLDAMYADGAEATMVYIHWGDEYALTPNKSQQEIAQQLCELGVDVIVGGHPHVVEPFETLTSTTGHSTYCIYSVGNAISNQRTDTLATTTRNAPYTEDGMIFNVVFQKWNDGRVEVGQINILPTWVNKEYKGGKNVYTIVPLDTAIEAWDGYDVTAVSNTFKSYNRTMSIIGEGYNACRQALGLPTVPLTVEAN